MNKNNNLTTIVDGAISLEDAQGIVHELFGYPEAMYYYEANRRISKASPGKFAIIKSSGECVQDSIDTIGNSVATLYVLGLTPVIVHGYGAELTRILKQAGIETSTDADGDRITDEKIMPYVLNIAQDFGKRIISSIESRGARVKLMPYESVFKAVPKSSSGKVTGSRNGVIKGVNVNCLEEAVRQGYIPVVSPIGLDENGTAYNINADTASSELVKALQPYKYIMLTGTNGILDNSGNTISEVALAKDYDRLVQTGIVSGGMLKKLNEVNELLRFLGTEHSVQITTPENLIRELFTKKGAGTYITLGYELEHAKLSDFDWSQLREIFESSFGARLKPDYGSRNADADVVVEKNLKGAEVFLLYLGHEVGPYLDMLGVKPELQGNGLGRVLMHDGMDILGIERLSWRSQPSRSANRWYRREIIESGNGGTDSIVSTDGIKYTAYWRGMTSSEAQPAIDYMKKPSNFVLEDFEKINLELIFSKFSLS